MSAVLQRETFVTSRVLDFFSEKELTAQVGHGREDWALVAIKELVDNAIDACEDGGIHPKIHVHVANDRLTVQDNGPGIPAETIQGVLNFTVRVSSREAYVSPCRGAQGNALKTLVAMPFVLDGTIGTVEIEAHAIRHRVTIRVDRITQKPILDHEQEAGLVRNGTCVTIFSKLNSETETEGFLQILSGFAWVNPHLDLTATVLDQRYHWPATNPGWKKWSPAEPSPAHWYGPEHLERLIAAYLSAGKDLTVREFLCLFRGLSSTQKQKAILDELSASRQSLGGLVRNKALDRERITALLASMQRHSRNINPEALGFIGKDHLATRLQELGAEIGTFQYDRQKGELSGIPWTIETAFAWCPSRNDEGRTIITGVNWSPAIVNPFREFGGLRYGLESTLTQLRVGHDEPVVLVVHMACARVQYADRGKSSVLMVDADPLIRSVTSATKKWTRQRKQEERDSRAHSRRMDAMLRSRRITIQDAAFRVMKQAYFKASSGGTLPANARQIMYAARPTIQDMTGRQLDDNYFTQTLLPDYIENNPAETADWDVVYDARGHFLEPHTNREVPLGTLAVRDYLSGGPSVYLPSPSIANTLFPTHGPKNRFGAILFIEKEGFLPLLQKVRLAERYDLAIMSTKGMSSTSARRLVDSLSHDGGVPLLIARDFDKAGFSIAATLQNDTRRYRFRNEMVVHDLGLRLEDVKKWQLESEAVSYGKSDPKGNLRENGATDEEIAFLCPGAGWYITGRRVELNAFPSDQFIQWLEEKLQACGIRKVMPDKKTLDEAYRCYLRTARLQKIVASASAQLDKQIQKAPIPKDLTRRVSEHLQVYPELSWDAAISELCSKRRAE